MKKRWIAIIAAVCMVITGVPVNVSAGIQDYPGYSDLTDYWDEYWMSNLPDDAKVNELSIPGAHDACAYNVEYGAVLNTYTRTQDMNIPDLLKNGVRYLDLRIEERDSVLYMTHGGIKLMEGSPADIYATQLKFTDVIENKIFPFLDKHPGETVITQVKCDKGGDVRAFAYLKELAVEHPEKVYVGDHVPTLGEARGKIIILSRLNTKPAQGMMQQDYAMDDDSGKYWALDVNLFQGGIEYEIDGKTVKSLGYTGGTQNSAAYTEDMYDEKPDKKWEWVQECLTGSYNATRIKKELRERDNRDAWCIIYSSLSYQDMDRFHADVAALIESLPNPILFNYFFISLIIDYDDMVWPREGANQVNPELEELLNNTDNKSLYTGCLVMDFVNETRSRLVYRTNFESRSQESWNTLFTVSFETDGGTEIEPAKVPYNENVPYPETPKKEGYYFNGWYDENDRSWDFTGDTVTDDMTLYAKWSSDTVPYIDAQGNDMTPAKVESIYFEDDGGYKVQTYPLKESNTTGGWYAAQTAFGDVMTAFTVEGDVNLILCSGVTLNAYRGFKVPEGSSLTIWAQSTDESVMGELVCYYTIGTTEGESCGKIVINGGKIQANVTENEAAIGGSGADVEINNGKVDASVSVEYVPEDGQYTPVIGGTKCNITISGGNIIAKGSTSNENTLTGIGGTGGTIDLSWTDPEDSIESVSYEGTVTLKEETPFRFKEGTAALSSNDILRSTNSTIVPKTYSGELTKVDRVEPTCIEEGTEAYWKDDAGNIYADEYGNTQLQEPAAIPALGHDWGTPTYEWNDVDDGMVCTALRTCQRDSNHAETLIVVADSEVKKEATEDEPGEIEYTANFDADWAETQTYTKKIPAGWNIFVGGIRVTRDNYTDILSDGKVSYDPDTDTLTLTNAVIETALRDDGNEKNTEYGIRYNMTENLTISLVGENKIVNNAVANESVIQECGIRIYQAPVFTVTGDGSLAIDMPAANGNIKYTGINSRQQTDLDGADITISMPGTACAVGYDITYTNMLTLKKGTGLTITAGSAEGSYAMTNNRDAENLTVEEGSILVAESGYRAFNEQNQITEETAALGATVDDGNGKTSWDGSTDLSSYKYIRIPAEEEIPAFTGHNLLLSSEIGVMFKVTLPEGTDTSNCAMNFTYSDERTAVTQDIADAEKVDDQNAYWFKCFINPLELADTITATFSYGDGKTIVNTFSAMDYISYVNTNWSEREDKAKLVTLVNELQNFGSYMQGSGWTDNKEHTAIAAAETLSDTDITAASDGVSGMAIVYEKLDDAGISDATFSLTLNADTVINVYAVLNDGVEIQSPEDYEIVTTDDVTKYKFVSPKIGAANLDKSYIFNIVTSQGTATIKACAMSYVNAILNSSTAADEQKYAMTAYYNYHIAAEEFVASRAN